MSDIQNQIEEVELDMETARKSIALRQALQNLQRNRDFQLLIEENYFKDEASRLVLLKAAQAMEADDHQKRIDMQIQTIGHFRQYLVFIDGWGLQAEAALKDHEATLEELRAEDTEGVH